MSRAQRARPGSSVTLFSVAAPASEGVVLHVLFVCTGNICRSPTAERLALARADRLGVIGLRASSAGTRAVIGSRMHVEAANVLEQLGGDASDFAARQLTRRLVAEADLVLTMTREHRSSVLELAPRSLHRTFTLNEAALLASIPELCGIADLAAFRSRASPNRVLDVPDPIGRGPDVFVEAGAQIAAAIQPVIEFLARSTRGA
ncbi:protein tyrosine phosphatase [Mycolicibacterium vaccae ATCC 25954]|uniref:Protein tyrosine phosphatase n=1 Tax=Mycolicibacterium vaccae ATCC 25954 TaxID=1194972 RepID=K0UW03_MYCVA|nr:protein tyrosine phosphatase [Mycolicibacterium vaccae ATCC 25954]